MLNRMDNIKFLNRVLMIALVALLLTSHKNKLNAQKNSDKPNIILILADDLDADELNYTYNDFDTWATQTGAVKKGFFKGSRKVASGLLTPNIDKLAKEGVMLNRFYVTGSVCTPSRYVFLTGKYATKGIHLQESYPAGSYATLNWSPALLKSENNIAKVLKQNGYRTGIVGKWHNTPHNEVKSKKLTNKERKPDPTFEEFMKYKDKMASNYNAHMDFFKEGFGWDVVDRMQWGNSVVNLGWMAEGALNFIEQSKNVPFFLFLPLPVPHGQYHFSYNDVKQLNPRVSAAGVLDKIPTSLPSNEDLYRRLKENNIPEENAMATHMDDYVGVLIEKLETLGIRDNTLIIFTSDHGSRGKNSCYEGGARVPFIANWPGHFKPGTVINSLIASNDVAVTLAAVTNSKLPKEMAQDGFNFLPQLKGRSAPKGWRKHILIEAGNSKGVVTKSWKYIANRVSPEVEAKMKAAPRKVFWSGVDHHNYRTEKLYPGYWDADQLYHLDSDLYEQTNLVNTSENKQKVSEMKAMLRSYVSDLPHAFGEFSKK